MSKELKDAIPVKKGTVLGVYNENYVVGLGGENEPVYMLSPIAYYVWSLCNGESSVSDIVSIVENNLNINRQDAENIVSIVIRKLSEVGLIALEHEKAKR